LKLVMIEWLDSHAGRGWQSIKQIKDSCEPLYCRSVGWLVSENKKCKIIVPHISGEKNGNIVLHGCGDLAIPTKAIVGLKILKIK
jgi:hypothetical protein